MTTDDVKNLKELLRVMEDKDPDYRVFGAERHKYRLGPPLSESELQAFEQRYQVALPADYRFFLKEVGDGGATRSTRRIEAINAGPGPGYGLLPLEETVLECDLSIPFPLTASMAGPSMPTVKRYGEEERYPGVLELATRGCTFYWYLVLNGPAYGTVWHANIDYGDFQPVAGSFDEWYRHWLDMLLEKALPTLANERVVERVQVGMTKAQIIDLCGRRWQLRSFLGNCRLLRFEHLATQFEIDENDILTRIICHSI